MKDERILSELNKTKLVIIYYLLFSSALLAAFKLLLGLEGLSNYLVEIFIFSASGLVLLIKITLSFYGRDERIESLFAIIGNTFFSIILFGGLFIHFASNAYGNTQNYIQYNLTSNFILIGIIVLISQLKRRNIYLHASLFLRFDSKYILIIFKRILFFALIMSINILPYIYFKNDLLIGILNVFISWLSLSITYLFFSIYEKNHYEETEMSAEEKYRGLSKNARLLYIPILAFQFLSLLFNAVFNISISQNPSTENVMQLTIIRMFIQLYGIDIAIISLLMYIVIKRHLRRINFSNKLINLLTVYMISSFVISIVSIITSVVFPIFIQLYNDISILTIFYKVNSFVSITFFIYTNTLLFAIIYQLYKIGVSDMNYLYFYAGVPVISTIVLQLGLSYENTFSIIVATILSITGFLCLYIFMKRKEDFVIDNRLLEENLNY